MDTINTIIDAIQKKETPVSDLLRRAKVLATKLNQPEIIKWIDGELNGYGNEEKVPEYRKVRGQVKFWNPYNGWCPVLFHDTKSENNISSRNTGQSVGELEDLMRHASGSFQIPYPDEVASKILEGAPLLSKVSLFISSASIVGILEAVRNQLLNWALELKRKGIGSDEIEFSEEDQGKAAQAQSVVNIGTIGKFQGNLGEGSSYKEAMNPIIPEQSLLSKIIWYIVVALAVVIIGNVISGLLLKYVFNIS